MKKHLPQLDGLRGIAVLIVLVGHVVVFGFGLGFKRLGPLPPLGVDLFFVLSGFLITNVLLEARASRHYYLNFYARRALRIWPLYAAVLIFLFTLSGHNLPGLTFGASRVQWPFFALFIQNLAYKQAVLLGPLALEATWSLAVEEQFYAIWPIAVRRLKQEHLIPVLVFVIALSPLARVAALHLNIDPYIHPLCRFDGMAYGALAALWIRTAKPSAQKMAKLAAWMIPVAVVAEVAILKLGLERYLTRTFNGLGFCGLLLAALSSPVIIGLLSRPVLRYTGKISYGIYLLHLPVAALVFALLPGVAWPLRLARAGAIIVGTVGAAALSWHFFESPILGLKRFFPVTAPTGDYRSTEPLETPVQAIPQAEPAA